MVSGEIDEKYHCNVSGRTYGQGSEIGLHGPKCSRTDMVRTSARTEVNRLH